MTADREELETPKIKLRFSVATINTVEKAASGKCTKATPLSLTIPKPPPYKNPKASTSQRKDAGADVAATPSKESPAAPTTSSETSTIAPTSSSKESTAVSTPTDSSKDSAAVSTTTTTGSSKVSAAASTTITNSSKGTTTVTTPKKSRMGPPPVPLRSRYVDGTFITYLASPREVTYISINPHAYRIPGLPKYLRVVETSIANISAFGQRASVQEYRWENSPGGLVPKHTRALAKFEWFYKLVSVHPMTDEILMAMFGVQKMEEFSWVDRGEGWGWFLREGQELWVGLEKAELVAAVCMWWGRGLEAEFAGVKWESLAGKHFRCVR
ncbi:hypothetical protein BDD12DRAFT_903414 [Trichophaea hybrida]|nr:hypothetical protein BDD12DRAFT_903414 [Trichophaea hybrida]